MGSARARATDVMIKYKTLRGRLNEAPVLSQIPCPDVFLFTFIGFIGGLTYVIMTAHSWSDFKCFGSAKRMMLGAIIGFIYFFMHSDYSWPNSVMTWVSGYAGPTFIDQLIEKRRRALSSA